MRQRFIPNYATRPLHYLSTAYGATMRILPLDMDVVSVEQSTDFWAMLFELPSHECIAAMISEDE